MELNETQFWNTRFDQSPYFFLTATATLGVLGVFFWVLFLLVTGVSATRAVLKQDEDGRWLTIFPWLVAWSAVAVSGFVYSSNMTLMFLLFLFSAMLASRMLRETYTHSFDDSPGAGLAFSFGAVFAGFLIVTLIFISSQRYLAESAYANAIRMSRADADVRDVISELDRATQFNRFNDLYYRNISQAFLIQIKDEIDSIQQAQDVSKEKRQYVQDLTGASIDAAKRATDLAPNNALNWRTRGQVYRELIPLVKNADRFAVEAFERAAELDPHNPTSYHELGKTYLAIAENTQQLTAAQDKAVREQAETDVEQALKKAEGNFQKAIERKADHAPAHYQLGLVFEQQGRIDDAIGKMESVTKYNELDVGAKFQTGVLYLRRGNEGDLERARKQFEEVIQLAPAYSNARWYLASIYEQTGELDKAVAQVEKVLEFNPDNRLVKTRLERLKRGETTDELPDAVEEDGAEAVPEDAESDAGENGAGEEETDDETEETPPKSEEPEIAPEE
jgi:tetratricopeptide (TPR) repeat protein